MQAPMVEVQSTFDQAMDYLLADEGLIYVNTPYDNGGPSKFGITIPTLSEYLGYRAMSDDIKNLTAVKAKEIYKELFWDRYRLDQLNQTAIAIALLDTMVLYGPGTATLLAQQALQIAGFPQITADGHLGPLSIGALNSASIKAFLVAFRQQIDARIRAIVSDNPEDEQFAPGWQARADRLLALA